MPKRAREQRVGHGLVHVILLLSAHGTRELLEDEHVRDVEDRLEADGVDEVHDLVKERLRHLQVANQLERPIKLLKIELTRAVVHGLTDAIELALGDADLEHPEHRRHLGQRDGAGAVTVKGLEDALEQHRVVGRLAAPRAEERHLLNALVASGEPLGRRPGRGQRRRVGRLGDLGLLGGVLHERHHGAAFLGRRRRRHQAARVGQAREALAVLSAPNALGAISLGRRHGRRGALQLPVVRIGAYRYSTSCVNTV